ncbi:hypothetical protein GGR26_000872 [Lewinella marina]|uniref:Uncharacterized protein n=1 Tax=Neolewinella marina TaxID=438751 RepID=A0A2G0CID7_9BACT|nr:hypothetical protein [Neolewinella marina]NJB85127.1 hypothetical protein [Neolewinella marina]PHK99736.1 hypothetical protein CGL56_01420 [Neolewinella marina]
MIQRLPAIVLVFLFAATLSAQNSTTPGHGPSPVEPVPVVAPVDRLPDPIVLPVATTVAPATPEGQSDFPAVRNMFADLSALLEEHPAFTRSI